VAEHPDVDRFRRALNARREAATSDDDVALLDGLFADDIVWHGAASGSGEAKGKADVIGLWNAFAKAGEGTPTIDVADVYADGEHAAALLELSVDGVGQVRQANIFHMNSEGKVAELWGLPPDRAIVEATAKGEPVPEHPNVATFLAAEEARQRSEFGPDDTATIRRFLADSVVWHMGGQSEFAKAPPTNTIDEVISKFKMFKQATGGTLFFDIHEVYADDTHAASFVTLTADHPDHSDRHMNVKEVNIFHLDSDGRAYEFWGIPTDEAERDAFWADDRTAEERLEAAKTALGLPALLTSRGTGGAISMLEVHLPPGKLLAPVHTHIDQDEASYILEGELSFYLDGDVHRFKAGQFAFKPKGVPHTIFNDTDAPARFIEFCWPGGLDDYLEDMAQVLSSGGPPDFKRIAEIAAKHGIESDFATIGQLGEKYGVRQIGM
jgi:quercetin dioxygenase-like cupin family protein/ketosteroid isomerase-like protein